MKEIREINLDCDGTWIDLYGVTGWLDDLQAHHVRPYLEAKPLVNLAWLARTIHELQQNGWKVNVISWLAKNSDEEFDKAVTAAKLKWLDMHLPSVQFDKISIVKYGTPKSTCGRGYLFDDEERNRQEWKGIAKTEQNLIKEMRALL